MPSFLDLSYLVSTEPHHPFQHRRPATRLLLCSAGDGVAAFSFSPSLELCSSSGKLVVSSVMFGYPRSSAFLGGWLAFVRLFLFNTFSFHSLLRNNWLAFLTRQNQAGEREISVMTVRVGILLCVVCVYELAQSPHKLQFDRIFLFSASQLPFLDDGLWPQLVPSTDGLLLLDSLSFYHPSSRFSFFLYFCLVLFSVQLKTSCFAPLELLAVMWCRCPVKCRPILLGSHAPSFKRYRSREQSRPGRRERL